MSRSNFKTEKLSYNITGRGETEAKAVEETFKHLRQEIAETFKKPIIAIRTIDYIVKKLNKEETEEAYLYIFMKRKRTTYDIEVTIEVEIDYVDLKGGK
jgi:uncharacterized protein (TIGR03578 family)